MFLTAASMLNVRSLRHGTQDKLASAAADPLPSFVRAGRMKIRAGTYGG